MSAYRKDFHETKFMLFLIKDELLEKHNEVLKNFRLNIRNLIVNQYTIKNI